MGKKIFSVIMSVILLLNTNVLTIAVAVSALSVYTTKAQADEDTPLLDKLRERYNIDDPYRNHLSEEAITAPARIHNRDVNAIIQQRIDNPLNKQVNMSGLDPSATIDPARYRALARGAGLTARTPAFNENGGIQTSYSKRGTREFYRDPETGELKIRIPADLGEIEYNNNGIGANEVFSAELDNDGNQFAADSKYQDREGYHEEGRATYERLTSTNTRTGDAFAYRAITGSATRALNTSVDEELLRPSAEFAEQAGRPDGGFFGACESQEIRIETDINAPNERMEYCYETGLDNALFCEVERTIEYEWSEPEQITCHIDLTDQMCGYWDGGSGSCMRCWAEAEDDTPQWDASGWNQTTIGHEEDNRPNINCNGDVVKTYNNGQQYDQLCEYGEDKLIVEETIHDYPTGCLSRVGEPGERITLAPDDEANFTNFELACTFDGYTPLEVGKNQYPNEILDEMGPLYPGDEGYKTWKANLDGYRCNPLGMGHYCPYGIPDDGSLDGCMTYENLLDNPGSCSPLIEDTACSEYDRVCADGMYDEVNDFCWVESVRFKCDDGTTITRVDSSITNSCQSMLPCIQGECGDGEPESNNDFGRALAMAGMMEDAANEDACISESGNNSCEIFKGESKTCRYDAFGLIPNCCKDTGGTNIFQYIEFAKMSMRVEKMYLDSRVTNFVKGGWNAIKDGANSVWNKMPWTSTAESAAGAAADETAEAAGSKIMERVGQKLMAAVYENMPEAWAEVFMSKATEEGGKATYQLSEGMQGVVDKFSSVLGPIMAAYSAYQMFKLAMNIFYACPDDSLDMGPKIAGGQCFEWRRRSSRTTVVPATKIYTEYHCCYSSALARIVMEQASPLLGKAPADCAGLTQSDLDNLDWNQIDLTEYIGLMYGAELVPEASIEGMTGRGRKLLNVEGITECPEGYNEEPDGLSCTKEAAPLMNQCPATKEEMVYQPDGAVLKCKAILSDESVTACEYEDGKAVIGYEENEEGESVPVYTSCGSFTTAKYNLGCPDGYALEGENKCIDRVTLGEIDRDNVLMRTGSRFNFDLDDTKRRGDAEARTVVDCSKPNRPPICEFGFDPRNNGGG